jgi:tetratricopeptide (TPR) repeat protein
MGSDSSTRDPRGRSAAEAIEGGAAGEVAGAMPAPDRETRILAFGAALAALVTWWPALRGEFLSWDDTAYVIENPMLRPLSLGNLWRMLTTSYAANWHPLTWLSHALDLAVFGENVAAHHAVNLALHAANAALLVLVLSALAGARGHSAVVAILFAVHPLRAESVVWIAERKDLLCGFFFLLAILAYARYVARPAPRMLAAVAICQMLALLAKPMAVTLPLVLIVLDVWPLRRIRLWRGARRDSRDGGQGEPSADAGNSARISALGALIEKAPLFALSAASSVITLLAQSGDKATISLESIPIASRVGNTIVSTASYVRMLVWPQGLSPFYPFPGLRGAPPQSAAAPIIAAIVLLAITLAVVRWRRRAPYAFAGWLWYLVMLIPVCGLVQVGTQAMADRYTYLPQIGLTFALVWAIDDALTAATAAATLAAKRRLATLALVVVAIPLVFASWRQASFWRDSIALWERAVAIGPPNAVAHGHLGHAYADAARYDDAIARFNAALALDPNYELAYFDLGLALSRLGRGEEAIEAFQRALALRPTLAGARYQIANRILRKGRVDEAIALYREAIRDEPELAEAHYDLAVLLAERGATDEAISHYEAAIRARPRYPEAQLNLGALLLRGGRAAEARALAAHVLSAHPSPELRTQAETLLRASEAAKRPG